MPAVFNALRIHDNPYKDSKEFEFDDYANEVAGTAYKKEFWIEKSNQERWFAKHHKEYASEPDKPMLEYSANRIYAYYGVSVARSFVVKKNNIQYFCSRWLDKFKCYEYLPEFPSMHQKYFSLTIETNQLQEQGLGHILAVAHFIDDPDVIGPTGHNIGYKLQLQFNNTDGNKLYAHSCKVDPGCAFWEITQPTQSNQDLDKAFKKYGLLAYDFKYIRIITKQDQAYESRLLSFDQELSEQTKTEFIHTIKDIIETPADVLNDFFKFMNNSKQKQFAVAWLKSRQIKLKKAFSKELEILPPLSKHIAHNIPAFSELLQQIYNYYLFTSYNITDVIPVNVHDVTNNATVSLGSVLKNFLTKNEFKVLALFGESGSGKTISSQQCQKELWGVKINTPKHNNFLEWVPIYIELKKFSIRTLKNCIKNVLIDDYKLTCKQIDELKQMPCLIILDGFDEIYKESVMFNFWDSNNLNAWKKVKLLITSRKIIVGINQQPITYQQFFVPNNKVNCYTEYNLLPISKQNIERYLNNYAKQYSEYWRTLFQQQTTLIDLLSNPLLLTIFKTILPQLRNHPASSSINKLMLYEMLLQKWFNDRHQHLALVQSHIANPRLTQASFQSYSEDLAMLMYESKTQLLNTDYNNSSDWYPIFSLPSAHRKAIFIGCPLKIQKNKEYSFIHKSFFEYFVAKHLWSFFERLEQDNSEINFFDNWGKRDITEEPGIIDFLKECFYKLSESKQIQLRDKLIQYIDNAKHYFSSLNCETIVAAVCGAISFLQAIQFTKNNINQLHIKLNDLMSLHDDIKKFLTFIAYGNQNEAENMLQHNPRLALMYGNVTDCAGREFTKITGLQYALWALDKHMWIMITKYLSVDEIKFQLNQLKTVSWIKPHGEEVNWEVLIEALTKYIDFYSNNDNVFNRNELIQIWRTQVGGAQTQLCLAPTRIPS